MKDLAGGDARLNASILEDVFGGAQNAVADALNLNAGVALAACEVAGSPQEGVAMAQVTHRQCPNPLLRGRLAVAAASQDSAANIFGTGYAEQAALRLLGLVSYPAECAVDQCRLT